MLTIHKGAEWVLPSIAKIAKRNQNVADRIRFSMPCIWTSFVDAYKKGA